MAVVWLWCGCGVALGWLWCSLRVAVVWLCTPESMPSICLLYGFEVALGGLSAGASRKSENSVIMRIAGFSEPLLAASLAFMHLVFAMSDPEACSEP